MSEGGVAAIFAGTGQLTIKVATMQQARATSDAVRHAGASFAENHWQPSWRKRHNTATRDPATNAHAVLFQVELGG